METWSSGHFDNDIAVDYLGEITGKLCSTIDETMSERPRLEPDEDESVLVPCKIELLNTFVRAGWEGVSLPTSQTAARWKITYMNMWDAHIDDLDPDEQYKAERREALLGTFDELIAHAIRRGR